MEGIKRIFTRRQIDLLIVLAVSFVLLLLLLAAGLFRPFNPQRDAAIHTLDLYRTVERLESSLGDAQPTGRVTKDYLNRLATIERHCQAIQQDATRTKAAQPGAPLPSTLRATKSLCTDLVGITKDSAATYRALLPLLTLDGDAKHYQELPGILTLTRSNDLQTISDTYQVVRHPTPQNGGFPSTVTSIVSQLNRTAKGSTDLHYKPALATAQAQLLGERQQYWTAYGGITDLKHELRVQLGRYCSQLELDKTSAVCTAAKEST